MGTMLEPTTMATDGSTGDAFIHGAPALDEEATFSASCLERKENRFPNDISGGSSVNGSPPNSSADFAPPDSSRSSAVALEDDMASTRREGPTPPPPTQQSPGEVLIKEFDALYQMHHRRVYRQCFRMLGSPEDAEDLTQEVFLQVFRKAHTFRGEASFSTWLHRLTINTVLMRFRRQRRWRETVTSYDVAPGGDQDLKEGNATGRALPPQATTVFDRIDLDMGIAQLSSGYKEIFLLHDLEGYRHDEIAKMLDISEGTSKSQLHKARLRLRTFIDSANGMGSSGNHPALPARNIRRKRSPAAPVVEYASA